MVMKLAQHVIATTPGKPSNLVFSPALINVILSFIAARDSGTTADQILSLLQTSSTDELNAVSSKIVTAVLADSTASGGPTISAANSVWMDKFLIVDPDFKYLLETSYNAAFNRVDLRKKVEVAEEVNLWVEKQTNGLITNVLQPSSISNKADHIFANALFFKGNWEKEFYPLRTEDSDFHLLDGTKVRVPFLTRKLFRDELVVYEGFKVLDLPYRVGSDYKVDRRDFSMQIFLPDEKDALSAMLEKLPFTRGFVNNFDVIPNHWGFIQKLKIPKLNFEFDFEASKALKGLGLKLSPEDELFQKACIEVDEMGSKAAAASASCSAGGSRYPPKRYDFVADHPFLFLIKEHRSGLILFIGQVIDPSK